MNYRRQLKIIFPIIWIDGKKDQSEERWRSAKSWGHRKKIILFPVFLDPEGRKIGSLKRRVRSRLARWQMKNIMPLWCEIYSKTKIYRDISVGRLLEIKISVVARHILGNKYIQNISILDGFWKWRYRTNLRHYIWKSKLIKIISLGILLEIESLKNTRG